MQVGSYSYETNAFKFGNSPYSYSMLQIPSQHLWHRNFNIQFGYRTFYPDGFLFAVPVSWEKLKFAVKLKFLLFRTRVINQSTTFISF